MKIKRGKPIIAYLLYPVFPEILKDTSMMVWGDVLYTEHELPEHLLAHEKVHVKQQHNKLLGTMWWIYYALSKKFRLEQEIEAFKEQP
jgi:hypothetical protein